MLVFILIADAATILLLFLFLLFVVMHFLYCHKAGNCLPVCHINVITDLLDIISYFYFSELDSVFVYNWQCRLRTEYRHVTNFAMKLNVLASLICQKNHVILAACRHLSLSLISNDSGKRRQVWYMLLWYVMFNVYVAYIQSRSQHPFVVLFVIMIIHFKCLAVRWTVDSQSLKLSR